MFIKHSPSSNSTSTRTSRKAGPSGPVGPRGPQGVRGEPGVCECDENEIEPLRNSVKELEDIPRNLYLF